MKLNNFKKILALSTILSASALSNLYESPYNKNDKHNRLESSVFITENDDNYDVNKNPTLYSVLSTPKNYFIPNVDIIFDIVRHDFNTNTDNLDSLIIKAKELLNISFIENEQAYPIILRHIDTFPQRKKIRNELLVDRILDTINTGSIIVDKYFIKASIEEESKYNIRASSSKNANGLMQITRSAWKEFGEGDYSNVTNPVKNIRAGINYYLWLEGFISSNYKEWDNYSIENKRKLLLAAYNGGPYRLKQRGFNINHMPKESINHINKVFKTMNRLHNEDLFIKLADYINKNDKSDISNGVIID